MLESGRKKLQKCYRYRNYETAIFLCSCLASVNAEYVLLKGILLYENGEYSRSIFHLNGLQSTTAVFYLALNYRKLKKYSEAIICLSHIVEHRTTEDHVKDPFVQSFTLDMRDTEFFDCLMGELFILKGKAKAGIEKHRKSLFKSPLLESVYGLFDENIWISPINDLSDDLVMNLYQNLFKASIQKTKEGQASHLKTGDQIPGTVLEASALHPEYEQCLSLIPGSGSYFISKIASMHCRFGEQKLGVQLFEILRSKDPFFITELDVYSTSLWISKNENILGLLAKDLIVSHPMHYVTWSVIGNYYSLKGMPKESTTCLMKSLSILENPFAYSLLGFEYNSRSQFLEAQSYFKSSICMLENNDKAYFGLGIALDETYKKQAAETYFKKALVLNPRCMNMKAYLVRFYVKNNEMDNAIKKIKEYLGICTDDFLEIVKFVENNFGKFSEIEELIVCELAEVLVRMKHKDLARKVIDCVQCRTSSYYSKRSIIENEV